MSNLSVVPNDNVNNLIGIQTVGNTTTLECGGACTGCGQWISYGWPHNCRGWLSNYSYTWPTPHQITRFCGAVKDLDRLPTDARVGDGYYVEKAKALVLRESGGWYHFDHAGSMDH